MKLNPAISKILSKAYAPCVGFETSCKGEMRWDPQGGHIPRGFAGAAGDLTDIELILVFAEPGDPHACEVHEDLSTAYQYALSCFEIGKDQFHKNVMAIIESCWPGASFEQAMRKVLLIDSVLCSAPVECGKVSPASSKYCSTTYLVPIVNLCPNALVVALGTKAQARLRSAGFHRFQTAYSPAPPGCNRIAAKESWQQIAKSLSAKSSIAI